jgi:hypothetical protein
MTDRDHSLQDDFDRHFRGDGPPPDTGDDPEAAAYHAVFSALHEAPEGTLSEDFGEQVADRVGLRRPPALLPSLLWSDVLLIFLAVAALGASLVLLPATLQHLQSVVATSAQALEALAVHVRLDIVLAAGLVLAATLGLDALLGRWAPLRRAPSPSR